MKFKKAKRSARKLRLAIAAPSGGGKTYSALRIAKGIIEVEGGKIAFIDTENNSASLYDHITDFDVVNIEAPYTIPDFNEAINAAKDGGYNVLIIDSSSHAWQQIQQVVDNITNSSTSKNSYVAWRKGTTITDKWLQNVLLYPGHVIFCMRSKMDYQMVEKGDGKKAVEKMGLAPIMRNGIEYEFDMMLDGNIDHYFTVTKSRFHKFSDLILNKPDEKFGKELIAWLNAAPVTETQDHVPTAKEIIPDPKPKSAKKFTPNPPIEKVQKPVADKSVTVQKPEPDNKRYKLPSQPTVDLSDVLSYNPQTINQEFKPICEKIVKGWAMLKYHDVHIKKSLQKHLEVSTLNKVASLNLLNGYFQVLRGKYQVQVAEAKAKKAGK